MKKIAILVLLLMPLMLVAQKGITFDVEKLSKPDRLLSLTSSSDDLYKRLILSDLNMSEDDAKSSGVDYEIISQSQSPDSLVDVGFNSFFNGMYLAYAEHRPFVLSPDMIWLLISQGFAHHINNNAERLRHHFVDFDGKETLVVATTNDLLAGEKEVWEEIFPQLTKQIERNVGNKLTEVLTCNFSTTTIASKVASEITIMEAMKPYFEYVVIRIVCGIPQITLEGTPEDWQKVLDKAIYLREYDLAWWIDELIPYLKEFVRASKGNIDKQFWMNMFKYHSQKRYGAPKIIDGWIVKFFPYDKYGKRNSLDSLNGNNMLPPEIVKVDLKYIDANDTKEYPLELWAGFVGLEQNPETFALKPHIGWMIKRKDVDNIGLQRKLKQDNENPNERGISIRVKTIPQAILSLGSINRLEVYFIDKIVIPDEMANVDIKILQLHGKISREEKERIKRMFPNTQLFFNQKEYIHTAIK